MRLAGAGPGEQGGTSSIIRGFRLLETSFHASSGRCVLSSSCLFMVFDAHTLHHCQMANEMKIKIHLSCILTIV